MIQVNKIRKTNHRQSSLILLILFPVQIQNYYYTKSLKKVHYEN